MLRPKPPLIRPDTGLADWTLDSALKRHVAEVLRYTGGDQVWAADELGMNPTTLHRWLRRWESGLVAREERKGPKGGKVQPHGIRRVVARRA